MWKGKATPFKKSYKSWSRGADPRENDDGVQPVERVEGEAREALNELPVRVLLHATLRSTRLEPERDFADREAELC